MVIVSMKIKLELKCREIAMSSRIDEAELGLEESRYTILVSVRHEIYVRFLKPKRFVCKFLYY